MTNHSANESELLQIEKLEKQIKALQEKQAHIQKRIKEFLFAEDADSGITFHADIFTLQQSKLRMDTEIQLLQACIGRLKLR